MSVALERRAVELLWSQWTAAGVAGNAPPPQQAIDLEAMIALTPYVATADPRLGDEVSDWCQRIGKSFISISRLRQITRLMPDRSQRNAGGLPSPLNVSSSSALSKKSRAPSLDLPCLVQLRSRYIFGVGARADILSRLVMRDRRAGALSAAAINPGYTKQAIATVVDELSQAGVLRRLVHTRMITYEVSKEAPLRSLLAPLPAQMPPWAERFAIVATILERWRQFGERATYAIELAKALGQIRPVVAKAGEVAPAFGKPAHVVAQVERWATSLLDDNVWEDTWMFADDDLTEEILHALHDRLVTVVHSGEFPVGYTELEGLRFRNVDQRKGTAEFVVRFTAQHPSEDFPFDGHVEGALLFDPSSTTSESLIDSMHVTDATAHFEMGDEGV